MNHNDTASPARTNTDLVARAQAGEEDAFGQLFEQHAGVAWRYAYALSGTNADATTIVSESFARAFTALRAGRVGHRVTFEMLLLTCTRNASIDVRRAHGDHKPPFEAPTDHVTLATAFASLPERWRSVLWLGEVEDRTARAMASVVGLSADATSDLSGRARKGLREQYLQADLKVRPDRNCGRSVARLGAYAAGTLPTAEIDNLERHLRLCEACAERSDRLNAITAGLPGLVPPMPDDTQDRVVAAWAGAVTTTAGFGVSKVAEKVLAGVAAVAAGVGVIGAALVSVGGSNAGNDQAVAPLAPIVTELAAPRPGDLDLAIDLTPSYANRTGFGARYGAGSSTGSPDAEFDGATLRSLGDGKGSIGSDGADDPDGPGGDNGGDGPTDPKTDEPNVENPGGDDQVVAVGASVAGVPLEAGVGNDTGATVGPIPVGSAPEDSDENTVTVDGPLAPIAPVVDPIDKGVTGLLGGL